MAEYKEAIKSTAGDGVLVHWGGVEGRLIASLPYLSDVHVIDGLSVCRFALGASGNGRFDLPDGLKFSLGMDVLAAIFGSQFTHTASQDTRDQIRILVALVRAFAAHYRSTGQL